MALLVKIIILLVQDNSITSQDNNITSQDDNITSQDNRLGGTVSAVETTKAGAPGGWRARL